MTKLIAQKIRMTQIFKDDIVVPVSVIQFAADSDLSGIEEGKKVRVVGVSKGKGFQGVVKRYGFRGGPKSHGQKHSHRAPGSIGSTTPQRVLPGKKMAGRMGSDRITLKGLKVVEIDNDKKTVLLKGSVPGNNGGRLEVVVN
jgi:large subunit ribosomal protein L3